MPAAARLCLHLGADDKAMIAKAAARMGTTMAGFVRAAAKEKAQQVLLDREARVTLSGRDFAAFSRAPDSAFALNPVLEAARTQARRRVRRA